MPPIIRPTAKWGKQGRPFQHGRGHFSRALLEDVAFGTRHIFETYAAAGTQPRRVLAVGDGVRNRVWLKSTSNITGPSQMLCRRTRGAPYGNAFLAARSARVAEPPDIDLWNPVDG